MRKVHAQSAEGGDLADDAVLDLPNTVFGADVRQHVDTRDDMKLDAALLDPLAESGVPHGDMTRSLAEVGRGRQG